MTLILTFFILSSLLSRLGRSAKARYDLIFEKGSRRDHAQVLANGGIAGALMVLTLALIPLILLISNPQRARE